MQLHTFFRSSAAYRVRIGLNIKGLTYESLPVNLRRGEQRSAAYRDLNPQQLVPTLVDDGFTLSQSLAILEYLDDRYPEPRLLPEDPRSRAEVRSMALAIACDIHPLNNLRVLDYLRTRLGQDDAGVNTWYAHWIAEGFKALESATLRHSEDRRHSYGDRLTLADVCLVPQWYNAQRFRCDLSPYPTLASICAHLESLPAFAAARPEIQPDAAQA